MACWLLKTEPDAFSWEDLVQRGDNGEPWTGVRNHQAKGFLSAMAAGDTALIYHTGLEKRIMGRAEVTRSAYPDPTDPTGAFVCVDVRAGAPLARPVGLAELKAEPALSDMMLVRAPRLSVQPVTDAALAVVLACAARSETAR
jgi:predicted RNA-binding protein with PUA-like domain